MEVSRHDIVLVGGGGAGLRAAIAAVEADPKLSVACVSKLYPMRSHTVSAEGGAAGVARDDDNLDLHAKDTIKGSDFLADQDAVEEFVVGGPARARTSSSTGAARGAARRTGAWRCAPSAA